MLKAFYTYDPDHEHCEIVFAGNRNLARQSCEARDWCDYIDIGARRLPHFDKYAEQGYVPKEELLKDGWWFECMVHHFREQLNNNKLYCTKHVYEEDAVIIEDKVICKECAEKLR
jgi:hypothetical protein